MGTLLPGGVPAIDSAVSSGESDSGFASVLADECDTHGAHRRAPSSLIPPEPKRPAPATRMPRGVGSVSVPDVIPLRPMGEGLPRGDLGQGSVFRWGPSSWQELPSREIAPETETSDPVESPRADPDITSVGLPIALASPALNPIDPVSETTEPRVLTGAALEVGLGCASSDSPLIRADPVPDGTGQDSNRETLQVRTEALNPAPVDYRRGVATPAGSIGVRPDEGRLLEFQATNRPHPIAEELAISNPKAALTSGRQEIRAGERLQHFPGFIVTQHERTPWNATPGSAPLGRQIPLEESVQGPMVNGGISLRTVRLADSPRFPLKLPTMASPLG